MKRHLILLMLPVLAACAATGTPLPPSPTVDSTTPTITPPTAIPDTSTPTTIPETDTPPPSPNPDTFPDPNNYAWQLIASSLIRPVDLQADGSGRLFVIEKPGHIHILENGLLIDAPFLNIEDRVNDSSNEMGLLGLAFHPNYAQNGYFYVNYTGAGGDTFISRFQVTDNPYLADPTSEINLLRVSQPFPNHNGGTLQFGPDGYLYAGLGDGGWRGDPNGNGQNTNALLGKILRLDVDHGDPYSIPADNPFGNEVWVYGLRNPWRMSFDKLTGDLFIGDVGQNAWEEIDHVPAGSAGGMNFGWNQFEGNHPYSGNPSEAGMTFPVAAALTFWWRRQPAAVATVAVWGFQNLFSIARYMADARVQELPLAGGTEHDFEHIFTRWGVLDRDVVIAAWTRGLGWLGLAATLGWLGWRWRRDRAA